MQHTACLPSAALVQPAHHADLRTCQRSLGCHKHATEWHGHHPAQHSLTPPAMGQSSAPHLPPSMQHSTAMTTVSHPLLTSPGLEGRLLWLPRTKPQRFTVGKLEKAHPLQPLKIGHMHLRSDPWVRVYSVPYLKWGRQGGGQVRGGGARQEEAQGRGLGDDVLWEWD